jgi:hypothetical protein
LYACSDLRFGRLAPEASAAVRWIAEAMAMRTGPALLMLLCSAVSCAGCAWSQKPAAQVGAPQQVAAAPPPAPAPAADATPRFECSDGTISVSQTGCLINMAHARLPPGEAGERTPDPAH